MAPRPPPSLKEAIYKDALEEGPRGKQHLLFHKGPQEGAHGQLNNQLKGQGQGKGSVYSYLNKLPLKLGGSLDRSPWERWAMWTPFSHRPWDMGAHVGIIVKIILVRTHGRKGEGGISVLVSV